MARDFTTRYDALGMAMPDPATMCHGECEGTGWVPVKADDERYAAAWAEAEIINPTDDGWHFVKCLDCGGTGEQEGGGDGQQPVACAKCGRMIDGFQAWGNNGWCDDCSYGEG